MFERNLKILLSLMLFTLLIGGVITSYSVITATLSFKYVQMFWAALCILYITASNFLFRL